MKFGEELEFGKNLLQTAARAVLPYFGSAVSVEYKADDSPVTIADKKAEENIRRAIEQHMPGAGIIGEEFGETAGVKNFQWTIDPIDGTKSFICGVPLFGTLLALLENSRPVLGLMGFPALNITVSAVSGEGCQINGVPAKVSKTEDIGCAVLLDGSITTMERMGLGEPWRRLRKRARLHRGWGDAYGYYLVASGRADVMIDPIAEIWDLAPMSVIIPESGGKFTSLRGGDFVHDRSGFASNGLLHEMILGEFSPYMDADQKSRFQE